VVNWWSLDFGAEGQIGDDDRADGRQGRKAWVRGADLSGGRWAYGAHHGVARSDKPSRSDAAIPQWPWARPWGVRRHDRQWGSVGATLHASPTASSRRLWLLLLFCYNTRPRARLLLVTAQRPYVKLSTETSYDLDGFGRLLYYCRIISFLFIFFYIHVF
jgi:hypothetical protein